MVNIEVHLPSCSVQEDIEPMLETRNDGQYLVLKEKMSLDFVHPDFFELFLPDDMDKKDKASLTLARTDELTKMQEKFIGEKVIVEDNEDVYMTSSYLHINFHFPVMTCLQSQKLRGIQAQCLISIFGMFLMIQMR